MAPGLSKFYFTKCIRIKWGFVNPVVVVRWRFSYPMFVSAVQMEPTHVELKANESRFSTAMPWDAVF